MKKSIKHYIFVSIICLGFIGCFEKKPVVCDCCENTYTEIESAINCIEKHPIVGTTSDNRLFLIAFVNKNIETEQNSSWNIIDSEEIISVAKRDYLLLTLDINDLSLLREKKATELLEIVKKYKDEQLFFVVTNQALYPFRDWKKDEKKEIIIDRLEIGSGP